MDRDYLEPALAEELLRRQDELQNEAQEVLADLDLIATLSRAGDVAVVGSLATGLMVWRDVDVGVVCDEWGPDVALWTMCPIASHPRVKRLSFVKEAGRFNNTGLTDGYYCGVRYITDGGDEWKLDVWFWSREAPSRDVEHARELGSRLTPESRLAVLGIKDACCRSPAYRREVLSVDVYDAVLRHGVRTPREFDAYLVARGKPPVSC